MKPQDIVARKRALLSKIQTEGAEAAYAAALAVCKDPKAPAPARATCATTLFRAAGFLNLREDTSPKEPHQMTADELTARLAELRNGDGQEDDEDPEAGGVFR
jgi:hypothetical protein